MRSLCNYNSSVAVPNYCNPPPCCDNIVILFATFVKLITQIKSESTTFEIYFVPLQGYREAIISRETAMFMTTTKVAIDLHTWLQDAAMAEEFFFATIARISQKQYRETGNVIQGNYCCMLTL